jgi:dihydropteroate synthase
VSEDLETERLLWAVELLAPKLGVPISADTRRRDPARAALEAGARVINDVSGLADPSVAALVAEHDAGVVLMANPSSQRRRTAATPIATVHALLAGCLERARAAGIPDERVVLDPGIGYFRNERVAWPVWDLQVLADLDALADLGRPLCVGVSRKSFIGEITQRAATEDRLAGSLAAATAAVLNGAALIRAHDVAETVDAVRVAERIRRAMRG